jgi:dipeptidyl aminopeptidase/acylaminoacyl peptidase
MNGPTPARGVRAAMTLILLGTASCASSNSDAPQPTAPIETSQSVAIDSATSETERTEPPTPETAGADAWMVIQVTANGRRELRLIDEDGNEVGAPASDVPGGDQTNPDWSPDGQMLTFVMTGDDRRDDLWLVDVQGEHPRMLHDCVGDCVYIDDPAWSPDGASIAVCVTRSVGNDDLGWLALVDVATGALSDLATFEDTQVCSGPRWSPDGSQIVLEVVERSGSTKYDSVTGVTLSIVDAGNGEVVQVLTDPALFAVTPDWNRVTGEIVYAALSEPSATAPALFVVPPDGSAAPRRLTPPPDGDVVAEEPSVSPDGASVVFVSSGSVVSGLAQIDPDTGTVERAFVEPVQANHPRHRPIPAS